MVLPTGNHFLHHPSANKEMKKQPHINSCQNCKHLHEDSESEMGYTLYSYLYCDKVERYMNLKSFPFKKEMPCFEMSYQSAIWVDEELKALYEKDTKNGKWDLQESESFKRFKEKYN